jgi:hypothetical protein
MDITSKILLLQEVRKSATRLRAKMSPDTEENNISHEINSHIHCLTQADTGYFNRRDIKQYNTQNNSGDTYDQMGDSRCKC